MSNKENVTKETKNKRKRSKRTVQQIKLAVIMIMVSVLVLSASTFAWYRMSKTASIQEMQFTADTLGNLLIAPVGSDGTTVGKYDNKLALMLNENNKAILLPATTANGKDFKSPIYDQAYPDVVNNVNNVQETEIIDGNQDTISDGTYYVYKKDFYIKTGDVEDPNKKYDIKLNGTGTYLKDKKTPDNLTADNYTSLRAIRVSFVVDGSTTIVYEPYVIDLSVEAKDAQTIATIDSGIQNTYGPTQYASTTLKQKIDGNFEGANKLCTLTEGVAKKVTMYVWFEGYDEECANEIALNTVVGQIQFEAEAAISTP